jgi:hypothetical protein
MLHEGSGQGSAFGLMDVVLDGVESGTSEQPAPYVMLWKTFPPARRSVISVISSILQSRSRF